MTENNFLSVISASFEEMFLKIIPFYLHDRLSKHIRPSQEEEPVKSLNPHLFISSTLAALLLCEFQH